MQKNKGPLHYTKALYNFCYFTFLACFKYDLLCKFAYDRNLVDFIFHAFDHSYDRADQYQDAYHDSDNSRNNDNAKARAESKRVQ